MLHEALLFQLGLSLKYFATAENVKKHQRFTWNILAVWPMLTCTHGILMAKNIGVFPKIFSMNQEKNIGAYTEICWLCGYFWYPSDIFANINFRGKKNLYGATGCRQLSCGDVYVFKFKSIVQELCLLRKVNYNLKDISCVHRKVSPAPPKKQTNWFAKPVSLKNLVRKTDQLFSCAAGP